MQPDGDESRQGSARGLGENGSDGKGGGISAREDSEDDGKVEDYSAQTSYSKERSERKWMAEVEMIRNGMMLWGFRGGDGNGCGGVIKMQQIKSNAYVCAYGGGGLLARICFQTRTKT